MQSYAQDRNKSAVKEQPHITNPIGVNSATNQKAHPILQLQPMIGNKAVQKKIAKAKLTIKQVGDINKDSTYIEDINEKKQLKPIVQQVHTPKIRLSMDRLFRVPSVPTILNQKTQPSDQVLPCDIRNEMELAFGENFSQVHVHTDYEAQNVCKVLDSRAFTVGNNIFFGTSNPNKYLIAHELTHVLQHKMVKPGKIEDRRTRRSDTAELEANLAADAMVRNQILPNISHRFPALTIAGDWGPIATIDEAENNPFEIVVQFDPVTGYIRVRLFNIESNEYGPIGYSDIGEVTQRLERGLNPYGIEVNDRVDEVGPILGWPRSELIYELTHIEERALRHAGLLSPGPVLFPEEIERRRQEIQEENELQWAIEAVQLQIEEEREQRLRASWEAEAEPEYLSSEELDEYAQGELPIFEEIEEENISPTEPLPASTAIRLYLANLAGDMLESWRLDAILAAHEFQPEGRTTEEQTNYWFMALAGNLLWASTVFAPEFTPLVAVVAFGGAIVGSGTVERIVHTSRQQAAERWPDLITNINAAVSGIEQNHMPHLVDRTTVQAIRLNITNPQVQEQLLWRQLFPNIEYSNRREQVRNTITQNLQRLWLIFLDNYNTWRRAIDRCGEQRYDERRGCGPQWICINECKRDYPFTPQMAFSGASLETLLLAPSSSVSPQ